MLLILVCTRMLEEECTLTLQAIKQDKIISTLLDGVAESVMME